jgi:hypothetical protein
VELVQLKRQDDDGGEVLAAVGPMEDDAADRYAARLQELVGQQVPPVPVATTSVESASGAVAGPPAEPADLLRAVLSRDDDAS